MTFSLFDHNAPHQEASQLVAFSRNQLDRRSEYRDEAMLGEALADPDARFFAIAAERLVMAMDGAAPRGLLNADDISGLDLDRSRAILLGWAADGAPWLGVPIATVPDDLPQRFKALDARSVYRQDLMDAQTLGAYAQANSLMAWALSNRFCGKCGGAMIQEAGGYRRRCSVCSHVVFPRTDPVAIMLAIDEVRDVCLLGRSPHFPLGMYSCLAGFVEPGETIEDAVRRETLEESGIRIGRVRYHASQPWPMPHSLMIGAFAEARNTEIVRDTAELEDCRWFDRREAEDMLAQTLGAAASAPPPGAIAHRLIRDWLDWRR